MKSLGILIGIALAATLTLVPAAARADINFGTGSVVITPPYVNGGLLNSTVVFSLHVRSNCGPPGPDQFPTSTSIRRSVCR